MQGKQSNAAAGWLNSRNISGKILVANVLQTAAVADQSVEEATMFSKFRARTALSWRNILAVLTVLTVLAGGTGLSWLASSLPKPTLSWQSSWSLASISHPGAATVR